MEVEEKIAVALHPPRCPKCGKEILQLRHEGRAIETFIFRITEDGEPDYTRIDIDGIDHNGYQCPECLEVLFRYEEHAISFLKGEE